MDPVTIGALLNTKLIGRHLLCLDSITSTNDYLAQRAGDLPEGATVTAEEQTLGRGRRGRQWSTSPGDSIAVSVLLKPEVESGIRHFVTSVAALSIARGIMDDTGIIPSIKWPNDIYLQGRKVAGILAEDLGAAPGRAIVLGMGINVNQDSFPESIASIATSLRIHGGRTYVREEILASVLNRLETDYDLFGRMGPAPFIDMLKEMSCVLGRNVHLNGPGMNIAGTAVDLGTGGELIVETDRGERISLLSGDVSLVI